FASWGLTDALLARAAAERVLRAADCHAPAFTAFDPTRVAARWIRSMVDDGSNGSDWFFRAPALLSRFPAAFLETEVPDVVHEELVDFLPALAPRSMPEQEVIGPITHVVRVAAEAMEGVAVQAQRSGESSFRGRSGPVS
ncbi:MAG TPA: hypothetical protein VHU80_07020, partial [Polyangiaceae bacterium]|nr:hypothetical protein [Polyangiaceae bacterium]